MRTFLNLVALVVVIGVAQSGHAVLSESLSSSEIAKRLNAKELTTEETYELLDSYDPNSSGPIFGKFSIQDFEPFFGFDVSDCKNGQMFKREQFINALQESGDNSQAYKNLINLCEELHQEMVKSCGFAQERVQ